MSHRSRIHSCEGETDPVNHVKVLDDQPSQSISQLLTKGILSNGNKEHVKYIFYYTDMGHNSYQLHFLHISMAIYFEILEICKTVRTNFI